MIKGRVIKGVSSAYVVETELGNLNCLARGKLKADGNIFVGDYVELNENKGEYIIAKVLPRRNSLIRPYVANIDICFIVIAVKPEPDFTLVDKIIVNALMADITPVLVVNKDDLIDNSFKDTILNDYKNVLQTVVCCALSGCGIDKIIDIAQNKVACFAGQSAVGKSSILNSILGGDFLKTGDLSAKIERGKHTTRQSLIIKVGNSSFIDTCGFSMFELFDDFDPRKLQEFYEEFLPFISSCRFKKSCTHTNEPDCAVRKAVDDGVLSKNRYDRYVKLYNELSEKWRNRYD
ncbi:MAG: ribosome small subunit-dependent GTPase A [Clostridia bacterium]